MALEKTLAESQLLNIPNFTCKEVFFERKHGNLQKAYEMARRLVQYNNHDVWNYKALAWCLVDLIKQNPQEQYIEQLKKIPESAHDEVLSKSIAYVLRMLNPLNASIDKAKMLSKMGQHRESANLYFRLLKEQPNNIHLHTPFAWELYRLTVEDLQKIPINVEKIKRYFFEYFKLSIEKPSILHNCFLRSALKLINNDKIDKKNNIDFVDFCQKWGLENLDADAYISSTSSQSLNNETYESPPLALSVFRAVLKNAIEQNNQQALVDLIAFIKSNLYRIKGELIWLNWDLAKAYHLIGDNKSALDILLSILKIKPNEYWLWDFLGDIYFSDNQELAISCYCRALLHQKDLNFVSKIKMKLVYYFIYHEDFERAKIELQEIIAHKQAQAQKISEELLQLSVEPWFETTKLIKHNRDFYIETSVHAGALLYQDLPWIHGVLGDTFDHNDKKKRKLFIKTESIPMEVSVPENHISGLLTKRAGNPIQIKGEWNNQKFQIYLVKNRQTVDSDDIFLPLVAVLDHINYEKKLVHFLISESIDVTIAQAELPFIPNLYDAVNLQISQHITKKGERRYKIHHITPNEKLEKAQHLIKPFKEHICINNGMGFGIESGLFFAPDIVKNFSLHSNDLVYGRAIKSYDRKKKSWGWRVIEISSVEKV